MKEDLKKYRITAFALLMVLGLHVVMPVAVLAAGFCNVEYNVPADTGILFEDCCDIEFNNSARDQDILDYCTFEQDCNPLPVHSFGEHKSLLPVKKQINSLPAGSVFVDTLYSRDKNRKTVNRISLDTSLFYLTPPVFLVNSTFLN